MQRERASQKERRKKARDRDREKKDSISNPTNKMRGKNRRGRKKVETFKENSSNRNNGIGEKEREQCRNITVSRDSFPRHYERWGDSSCPKTVAAPTQGPPWGQCPSQQTQLVIPGAEQHLPLGAVNFTRTLLAARLLHTWSTLLSCRN